MKFLHYISLWRCFIMQDTIHKAVLNYYGILPKNIKELGGGFYGRAFLISLDCEPFLVVLKLYLFSGLAVKEAEQINKLSQYALLKMPRIYQVLEKEQTGDLYDVLFMEYINDINAGDFAVYELPEKSKDTICENIVDNLIAFHKVVNMQGFGALSSEKYCSNWQEYYYPMAKSIVQKAKILLEKEQLSTMVLSILEQSIKQFNDIFYLPITQARLIHGDYNTWNIMLDEKRSHAIAVIDPFQCCWADSEFDLYQLDNANGKEYGLLKRYSKKIPLSENFESKRRFYELYTEINHYYDSQVKVDLKAVEVLAERLEEVL